MAAFGGFAIAQPRQRPPVCSSSHRQHGRGRRRPEVVEGLLLVGIIKISLLRPDGSWLGSVTEKETFCIDVFTLLFLTSIYITELNLNFYKLPLRFFFSLSHYSVQTHIAKQSQQVSLPLNVTQAVSNSLFLSVYTSCKKYRGRLGEPMRIFTPETQRITDAAFWILNYKSMLCQFLLPFGILMPSFWNRHRCCNYENKLVKVVHPFPVPQKWECYWFLKSSFESIAEFWNPPQWSVYLQSCHCSLLVDCSTPTKLSKLPFSAEDASQDWTNDLYRVITSFSHQELAWCICHSCRP